MWQFQNKVVPIEIKAGKSGHLKSLHYFMKEKSCHIGVRFNADRPSILDEKANLPNEKAFNCRLISLPFYLVGQLNRLLKEHAN